MFFQGLFHMKITLCYTHILELLPEAYKDISATIITTFDASSLAVFGLILNFVTRDFVLFMQVANVIGFSACLIYLVIAPESPHWLMMQKRYQEGIDQINWISWANGSQARIPTDA